MDLNMFANGTKMRENKREMNINVRVHNETAYMIAVMKRVEV